MKHAITQAAVMTVAAILTIGCSKSSSRSLRDAPQITIKSDEQTFLTNIVDVLRAKYSENERSLQEGQAKLAQLRTMNMPYQDEQRELEQLEAFQRALTAKILADKMGREIKSPSR